MTSGWTLEKLRSAITNDDDIMIRARYDTGMECDLMGTEPIRIWPRPRDDSNESLEEAVQEALRAVYFDDIGIEIREPELIGSWWRGFAMVLSFGWTSPGWFPVMIRAENHDRDEAVRRLREMVMESATFQWKMV